MYTDKQLLEATDRQWLWQAITELVDGISGGVRQLKLAIERFVALGHQFPADKGMWWAKHLRRYAEGNLDIEAFLALLNNRPLLEKVSAMEDRKAQRAFALNEEVKVCQPCGSVVSVKARDMTTAQRKVAICRAGIRSVDQQVEFMQERTKLARNGHCAVDTRDAHQALKVLRRELSSIGALEPCLESLERIRQHLRRVSANL
jgi:hypothetical protein